MRTQAEIEQEVTQPTPHAIRGQLCFKGAPKVYKMAYLEGFPHVEVESYYGQGVIVSYLMTGLTFSWEWQYRNEGWDWARGKALHVGEIKAAGNEYARRIR